MLNLCYTISKIKPSSLGGFVYNLSKWYNKKIIFKYMLKNMRCGGTAGGAYGLAFLGALVYYLQHADGFWVGVLGVLKAIIWPAMLVYKLLEFFKM